MDARRPRVSCYTPALMLLALLLCGCETPPQTLRVPYTAYRSPNLLPQPPRRTLLMPIENVTRVGEFADRWYSTLAGELRSTKQFEVVTTTPDIPCVRQCMALLRRGQYDEKALVAVRDYFRVDAVIFVNMTDYYPYWPPRMAVSLNLVEATQGETVAAVDGNWDAGHDDVQQLVRLYSRGATPAHTLNDPDLTLISPDYFGKFVAHELSQALSRLLQPEVLAMPDFGSNGQVGGPCHATDSDCDPPATDCRPTDEDNLEPVEAIPTATEEEDVSDQPAITRIPFLRSVLR